MSVPPGLARLVIAALAALVMAALSAAPALAGPTGPAGTPREMSPSQRAAAVVGPSVVHLTAEFVGWVADEKGAFFNGGRPYQLTGTCTGFVVNPDGYIATAGHCVDTTSGYGIRSSFIRSAAEERVASNPGLVLEDVVAAGYANWSVEGQTPGSPIESWIYAVGGAVGAPGEGAVEARLVDHRPLDEGDVALLKVDATRLPTLELAVGSEIPVGTPLLSAGYAASVGQLVGPGAEPSIKDGEVSGRQTVGSTSVYEISAALTPGMSGGPTVDLDGRVLGINSFGPFRETQSFNFIAPAGGLAEMLSRNGVRNELAPADVLYREALTAYHAGHYSGAISAFDRVLQEVPTHPRASQLRADAIAARDRFGDAEGPGLPPLASWAIVGGGIALGTGICVLVAVRGRRRRRRKAAAAPDLYRPPAPWFAGSPAGSGRPGAGTPAGLGGPGGPFRGAAPVPPGGAPFPGRPPGAMVAPPATPASAGTPGAAPAPKRPAAAGPAPRAPFAGGPSTPASAAAPNRSAPGAPARPFPPAPGGRTMRIAPPNRSVPGPPPGSPEGRTVQLAAPARPARRPAAGPEALVRRPAAPTRGAVTPPPDATATPEAAPAERAAGATPETTAAPAEPADGPGPEPAAADGVGPRRA